MILCNTAYCQTLVPCCQDFILEHYSEDGNNYEDEIADLMDLRQVSDSHSLNSWKSETESRGFLPLQSPPCSKWFYRLFFSLWLQACRTPSRSEEGVELLAKYFSHLPLMESRFFSQAHHSGIFFTWCVLCTKNTHQILWQKIIKSDNK